MHIKPLLPLLFLFLLGAGPCDIFDSPLDTNEPDETTDSQDCETPCTNELWVDVIRSDNQAFADGAYDFYISMPELGDLSINCWLWTSMLEQPLECTYIGPLPPSLTLENSGTTFALAIPAAPMTSTWIVTHSGGEIGRKQLTPTYQPQAQTGCAAACVEADEVMAVEIW